MTADKFVSRKNDGPFRKNKLNSIDHLCRLDKMHHCIFTSCLGFCHCLKHYILLNSRNSFNLYSNYAQLNGFKRFSLFFRILNNG